MARWRQVKKYGNSVVIHFSKVDVEDLNIKEGDWMDIEDMVFQKSIPEELMKDGEPKWTQQ